MRRVLRLVAPLLASLIVSSAIAQTQPRFSLRGDYVTGSAIPELLAFTNGRIPLNKQYHELTSKQKAVLASFYTGLGAGDEPPFPSDSLEPIVRLLHRAQKRLLVTGLLTLIIDVGPDGTPTEVKAIGSPSPEMTKVAAGVLLLTKFKPAVCAGQPCRMQYPFELEFKVR